MTWDQISSKLLDGLDDVFVRILSMGEEGDKGTERWDAFVEAARKRFEEGRDEHAGTDSSWESWTDEQFVANLNEELIDCVIYAAAFRLRKLGAS